VSFPTLGFSINFVGVGTSEVHPTNHVECHHRCCQCSCMDLTANPLQFNSNVATKVFFFTLSVDCQKFLLPNEICLCLRHLIHFLQLDSGDL
ncbi:hypothetical protein KUF71_022994, partial [Frankliniella fusca]